MATRVDRRHFLAAGCSALAAACGRDLLVPHVREGSPRLSARPSRLLGTDLAPGMHRRTLAGTDLVLYLPATARRRPRVPLMVFLHGAGRTVEAFVDAHRPIADETGVMVLAPYAAIDTWDRLNGPYHRDVAAIDLVLQWVFHEVPVARDAIALSGFSDGAAYALALGRGNGDLFRRLIAYSPHSLLPTAPVGLPPITVTHGTFDALVPWGISAEYVVPALRAAGHEVEFVSFTGTHAVPLQVVTEAMRALGGVSAPVPA